MIIKEKIPCTRNFNSWIQETIKLKECKSTYLLFTFVQENHVLKSTFSKHGLWVFYKCALPNNLSTVIFLSFRTVRSGKQCRPRSDCSYRSSLIRVYTVCNSLCIFWMHYSKEMPSCSTFRVITTNFLGVRIFRKFTVYYPWKFFFQSVSLVLVSFSSCPFIVD